MIKLSVPTPIMKLVGRQVLQVQKYSPQMLLVSGVAGVTVSAVLACRATLKLDEVLVDAEKTTETIHELQSPDYTETDKVKDLAKLKVKTAQRIVRLYAPAVGLGVVSIGAIAGSHRIMSTRNAGLAAAYATLEKGFDAYRERVAKELGPDKEREFRYGNELEEHVEDDGRITKTLIGGKEGRSIYARFFDEYSKNWNNAPTYNQMFLRSTQNYMNDLLNARGHVFLNEVYDALGLDRSKEGAVVGWVKGNGDNYIDFGVFEGDLWSAMRFVNGDEKSILLDFNVDGVIYNLI